VFRRACGLQPGEGRGTVVMVPDGAMGNGKTDAKEPVNAPCKGVHRLGCFAFFASFASSI